jgi:hypothetical protein
MTGIACIGSDRVGTGFRRRNPSVVTRNTLVRGLAVVKGRDQCGPQRGNVARLARVRRYRVRRRFTRWPAGAVMTARAGARLAYHRTVIERRAQPRRRGMAGIARRSGRYVRWPLTRGDRTVVAGFTTIRSLGMIER